jgi:hypothetical protein
MVHGEIMIRYFENNKTKEKVRWDPAQIRNNGVLLPGRAGLNHWHRIDTIESGLYLDADGQKCLLSEPKSVLAPKEQINIDINDYSYDEEIIDEVNTKLIMLLDEVTTNWLHDSIIKDIQTNVTVTEIHFVFHNDSGKELLIKFLRADGIFEQNNINGYIGKEIYRIKLHKRNYGNEIEIITSENDSLVVFYDDIEYMEIEV